MGVPVGMQILVAGPAANRPSLTAALGRQGYELLCARTTPEALHILARWKAVGLVVDAGLDGMVDGTLLARVMAAEPGLAVVVLADEPELAAAVRSLKSGALDYLPASSPPDQVVAAVQQALERCAGASRERALAASLRDEVSTLAAALRQEREQRDRVALAAMESLVCVVETKDRWLAGHSVRVAQLAASLAAELGRTDLEIEEVRLAGRLHDIGMVGVADRILAKEGPLTAEEFDQVRAHVTLGSDIVAPMPGLGTVARFVRHHHERWDGQGYPDGLAGEAAPWGARLIGCAEIYDALTTNRPYREPMSPDLAVRQMESLVGTAIGEPEWNALEAVVGRREALVFVVDRRTETSVAARAATLHL